MRKAVILLVIIVLAGMNFRAVSQPQTRRTTPRTAQAGPPSAQAQQQPASLSTFTDSRDGQTYRTVRVGNRIWMAQNLNFRPRTDNTWCYGNDDSNCAKYGRLYTWATAMSACPAGWRLPTRQDWDDLLWEVDGKDAAGRMLKSKTGWNEDGNTDDFGFSALPGGHRFYDEHGIHGGPGDIFLTIGDYGWWWSATESQRGLAWARYMVTGRLGVYDDNNDKDVGFSVRCVQTAPGVAPSSATASGTTTPVGQVVSPTPTVVQSATVPSPTSAPVSNANTFTDSRDGQTYRTVRIGNRTWMAQNLNFRPRTDNTWCYDYDNSNCAKYGRLYAWDAARSACPAGWRLPTRHDWDDLAWDAGGDGVAGKRLKSETGWNNNTNGTDDFGFSALPGGYRFQDDSFNSVGDEGHWWTATENDRYDAWIWTMGIETVRGGMYGSSGRKDSGSSVRCVQ